MQRLLMTLLFVFTASAAVAQSDSAEIRAAIGRAVEGKAVPAVGILEIRNGQVSSETVWGVRQMGRPEPVQVGDRWHLGSDTKAMTATLIAVLVEKGKLSWTARLDEMLPELAATMDPSYRDVTLVDLLAHRSGLPENVDDEAYYHTFYSDPRPVTEQRFAYISRALTEKPVGEKRTERFYSNTGYILAGLIAERAMHKPYEELMQTYVFKPLGMSSASFEWVAGNPVGHVDGRPALQQFDPNTGMLAPAGLAQMTLRDWAKFCIDQMNGAQGHGRLLRTETYRLMQTNTGGAKNGLGWGVAPSIAGLQGPVLTHVGSDGNWYAIVALFPQTGNGALVVANAADSMGGDAATGALLRERIKLLGQPAAPVPAPAPATGG